MATAKKAKAKVGKMKIGEVTFTQQSCGLSKTSAQDTANKIRKSNHMARVIKNDTGTGFCVFKGPLSKTLAKRNAAAKVTGTKRKTTAKKTTKRK